MQSWASMHPLLLSSLSSESAKIGTEELWAVQAAKASGNLDLEKLMDMKDAGIEVESFVSEEMRLQMYQKEVLAHPAQQLPHSWPV